MKHILQDNGSLTSRIEFPWIVDEIQVSQTEILANRNNFLSYDVPIEEARIIFSCKLVQFGKDASVGILPVRPVESQVHRLHQTIQVPGIARV
jgi:hypothetical protein